MDDDGRGDEFRETLLRPARPEDLDSLEGLFDEPWLVHPGVELDLWENNDLALRFYEARGFETIKRRLGLSRT